MSPKLLRAALLSLVVSSPALADRRADDVMALGAPIELGPRVAAAEALRLAEAGGAKVLADCSAYPVATCARLVQWGARVRVPGSYGVNAVLTMADEAADASLILAKAEEFGVVGLESLRGRGVRIERAVDGRDRESDVEAALRRGDDLLVGPAVPDVTLFHWQRDAKGVVDVDCRTRSFQSCLFAVQDGASAQVSYPPYNWQATREIFQALHASKRLLVDAQGWDWATLKALAGEGITIRFTR